MREDRPYDHRGAPPGVTSGQRRVDKVRKNYDRIAVWYDRIATPFEAPHRRRMVEMLDVHPGESVLDVGFGPGDVVEQLARRVGAGGTTAGIDISARMKTVATQKLEHSGLADRTELRVGDARRLPFDDGRFDAVCSSFTIELFASDEIQTVLGECRRVMRPDGRMAIASLSTHDQTAMRRFYELAHRLFPTTLDCRPIPVEAVLKTAHFTVHDAAYSRMAGIPVAVVLARPRQAPRAP